jgi:hypothetical protein
VKLHRTIVVTLGLAFVFSLRSTFACSRVVGPPVKVKTSFVVFVHDPSGRPLPNMKVTTFESIRKSGGVPAHVELAAVAITGRDGKAAIGLTQDDYSLGASINGISSEVLRIAVYDDGSGASEISLTWPGGPITQIQNASGKLGVGPEKAPWVGAEVVLKNAGSDKSIRASTTDAEGRFSFNDVPPGFYTLHLKDPNAMPAPTRIPQLEGDVAIEVRKDAPNAELPSWGFVAGSCGLSAYTSAHSMIIFTP